MYSWTCLRFVWKVAVQQFVCVLYRFKQEAERCFGGVYWRRRTFQTTGRGLQVYYWHLTGQRIYVFLDQELISCSYSSCSCCCCSCWGNLFQICLRFNQFKSDWGEIWQECSWEKQPIWVIINVSSCHWNTCKFVFTITCSPIPGLVQLVWTWMHPYTSKQRLSHWLWCCSWSTMDSSESFLSSTLKLRSLMSYLVTCSCPSSRDRPALRPSSLAILVYTAFLSAAVSK